MLILPPFLFQLGYEFKQTMNDLIFFHFEILV